MIRLPTSGASTSEFQMNTYLLTACQHSPVLNLYLVKLHVNTSVACCAQACSEVLTASWRQTRQPSQPLSNCRDISESYGLGRFYSKGRVGDWNVMVRASDVPARLVRTLAHMRPVGAACRKMSHSTRLSKCVVSADHGAPGPQPVRHVHGGVGAVHTPHAGLRGRREHHDAVPPSQKRVRAGIFSSFC